MNSRMTVTVICATIILLVILSGSACKNDPDNIEIMMAGAAVMTQPTTSPKPPDCYLVNGSTTLSYGPSATASTTPASVPVQFLLVYYYGIILVPDIAPSQTLRITGTNITGLSLMPAVYKDGICPIDYATLATEGADYTKDTSVNDIYDYQFTVQGDYSLAFLLTVNVPDLSVVIF